MRFYSISLQKVPVIVAETAPASCFDVCWANRNKNAEINLQVTQQNALIFITPQLTRDKGVKTLNFSECFFKKKNIAYNMPAPCHLSDTGNTLGVCLLF